MTATQTNGPTKAKDAPPISEYVTKRVARKDVFVNPEVNARKHMDEERFNLLKESIRQVGLEQPPLVRPSGPTDKTDKAWTLYAGFRRMRAVDALGWDSLDVRTPAGPRAPKDLALGALAENLARDSLSPYDTAAECDRVVRDYKASEVEVAAATGISRSHVNNLVRCFRKLPPDALAAWGDPAHPANKIATMDRLLKVAAAESDVDRQALWDEYVKGAPAASAAPAVPGAAPTPAAAPNAPVTRVMKERVTALVGFVNSKEGKEYAPPRDPAWFGAFARYLAGMRDKPPEGMDLGPKKPEPKPDPVADIMAKLSPDERAALAGQMKKRGKKRAEGGKRARGEKA